MTVKLTELQARTILASILWTRMLVAEDKLDIYDWQDVALEEIDNILTKELYSHDTQTL